MSKHHIERAGVRLAYEVRGSGPAVVLVQGLAMPGRMWLDLPERVVERGLSAVVPDARGTGDSDAPLPPYSISGLADDLAAVIRAVDLGPAIVVGISLGGMTAQELALRHPEQVAGLVLAATTCGRPLGKSPRWKMPFMLVRGLMGDMEVMRKTADILVHPENLKKDPMLFENWARQMRTVKIKRGGVLGQIAAALMHGTGYSLDRITCPVAVITGDSDMVIPPENSRILAERIPGARLTIVPRSGHCFPLEDLKALPNAVDWVREQIGW